MKYVWQILDVVMIILLLLMSVMGIGLFILSYLSEFWTGMIVSLMVAIDMVKAFKIYTYSPAIDKG